MDALVTSGLCPRCGGETVRVARTIYSRRAGQVPIHRLACPRCEHDEWQPCAVQGCGMRVPPGQRMCSRCQEEYEALSAPLVSGGLTIRGDEERSWRWPALDEWLGIALTVFCVFAGVWLFLLAGGAR